MDKIRVVPVLSNSCGVHEEFPFNTVGKFHNIGEIVLQLGTTEFVKREAGLVRTKNKKRSFLRWNYLEWLGMS